MEYATLFTSLKGDVSFSATDPTRYHNQDENDFSFIHSYLQLDSFVRNVLRTTLPRGMKPYTLKFSILKSDPSLLHPQEVHFEPDTPYSLSDNNVFSFSILIGLEEHSFHDVKLTSIEKPGHVCFD